MIKKLRKYIAKQRINKSFDSDIFFLRLSQISQFGLLLVAIFGYFYTVLPLYEKARLTEEIAKNEIKLNDLKIQLEENYQQRRNSLVGGFFVSASMTCSGLLRRPTELKKLLPLSQKEESNVKPPTKQDNFNLLHMDISECLHTTLNQSRLKTQLRSKDYKHLTLKVNEYSTALEIIRQKKLSEAENSQSSFSIEQSYGQTIREILKPQPLNWP